MKYGMRERISGIVIVIALLIIFVPMLMSTPEPQESRPEPELTVERPIDVPRHDLEDPAPPLRLDTSSQISGPGQSSEAQPDDAPDREQTADAEASQGADRPADDPIARLAREAEQRQAAASGDSSGDSGSASDGLTSSGSTDSRSSTGSKTAATPGGEWAVQVGSFGKPDNASGLEKRLNEKGYPAYQRDRGNNLTSVYVGPFATSEAAESVMAKLKAELNQQGLLVRTGQ
jgi:DedD protein